MPLAGLAVVPLQVAAWLLRGFVFEYLALTALGAYLTQYRHYLRGQAVTRSGPPFDRGPLRMINYDAFLSHGPLLMQESAIRRMGAVLTSGATSSRSHRGIPPTRRSPGRLPEIARELLGRGRQRPPAGPTRGFRPPEAIVSIMQARGVTSTPSVCS